jgi:hypothetical protein
MNGRDSADGSAIQSGASVSPHFGLLGEDSVVFRLIFPACAIRAISARSGMLRD